jgi:hypothetical protein
MISCGRLVISEGSRNASHCKREANRTNPPHRRFGTSSLHFRHLARSRPASRPAKTASRRINIELEHWEGIDTRSTAGCGSASAKDEQSQDDNQENDLE